MVAACVSEAAILKDIQALLLELNVELHQMTTTVFWNPVHMSFC